MTALDITGRRLLVLPRDAAKLGVEEPDSFEVALAVRMSAGIPFYFEPVKFRNEGEADLTVYLGRITVIE